MPAFGSNPGEPDPGQSRIDWVVVAPPPELAPEVMEASWRTFSCWSMPDSSGTDL
jgi:hypothetical protein